MELKRKRKPLKGKRRTCFWFEVGSGDPKYVVHEDKRWQEDIRGIVTPGLFKRRWRYVEGLKGSTGTEWVYGVWLYVKIRRNDAPPRPKFRGRYPSSGPRWWMTTPWNSFHKYDHQRTNGSMGEESKGTRRDETRHVDVQGLTSQSVTFRGHSATSSPFPFSLSHKEDESNDTVGTEVDGVCPENTKVEGVYLSFPLLGLLDPIQV